MLLEEQTPSSGGTIDFLQPLQLQAHVTYTLLVQCSATGGDYYNGSSAQYTVELTRQCSGDVNGDWIIDVPDLLLVLGAWGNPGGTEDVNGDGVVDVLDLLEIHSAWGEC